MEQTPISTPSVKRTGRPVHPLWVHFHRGEKRNRYHYHAFCSYCVARHGLDHVRPTRGVSVDMLRHLKHCGNCPPQVVLESVKKSTTARREQTKQANKTVNVHKSSAARLREHKDHALLLETVETTSEALDDAAVVAIAVDDEATVDHLAAAEETLCDVDGCEANSGDAEEKSQLRQNSGQDADQFSVVHDAVLSIKRHGESDTNKEGDDVMTRWRTGLLQTAVATGMPLSAFSNREFQELFHMLSPVKLESKDTISTVGSQAFLEDTAAKLAQRQLERVKEGMLNSTIKSGLTLSVTCWHTLDRQHLAAFTLVNSNGDAACVRVEDVGGYVVRRSCADTDSEKSACSPHVLPLERVIEDVLLDLNEKDICVIGIVADSAVALSAAKRVCCNTRWRSLLVIPCASALLASLAGSLLTHDTYRDTVGQLVELAAYFSNPQLQASLRAISGEDNTRIPLPTKSHWFSFVNCLSKVLHYSDAITVLCLSQQDGFSTSVPLALRELVLGSNGQLWTTLRSLAVLIAPLWEAFRLIFQSESKLDEVHHADGNDDECTTTVREGLTLAHIMYQLGRMSQQYEAIAHPASIGASSSRIDKETSVVAQRLCELLETMWQRYEVPTMVLAYVFNFHMDNGRLNSSNSALDWKAVVSYFQHYFQRWFCRLQENQGRTERGPADLAPISSAKVEAILNAYQLRQFPFGADTTSDYADVSSFYSFVSDSHPEICALCCRVYAVGLACASLRRIVRGVGVLPSVAQTTEQPKQIELLLHVGYASSLKKRRRTGTCADSGNILPELSQASRPEDLLCSYDDWDLFSSDWQQLLDDEMATDETMPLHCLRLDSSANGHHEIKNDAAVGLSLDQLFAGALPSLPAAGAVAPSPHDPTATIAHASVAL
ncbi:unnamed protein product [Hyaloperonospora brassicae]|uniref:BED-type domain-containing protein n=1 Tax=Hyaloperonospora brassicae TaxID=162125 RepID=A0AAV0T7V1_HYABA|nr:unnamed protein product [Hyaloperonospora brassicae]